MALVTDKQFFILGAVALIGGGYLIYRASQAADAAGEWVADVRETAGEMAEKVNPASPNNLLYSGVSNLGAWATGDESYTLGSSIYDMVDSVRGWWGDSDADRQRAAYEAARAAREQSDPNPYETTGFGTPSYVPTLGGF